MSDVTREALVKAMSEHYADEYGGMLVHWAFIHYGLSFTDPDDTHYSYETSPMPMHESTGLLYMLSRINENRLTLSDDDEE